MRLVPQSPNTWDTELWISSASENPSGGKKKKSNGVIAHAIARFGLNSGSGEIPAPISGSTCGWRNFGNRQRGPQFRNRSTRSVKPADSAAYVQYSLGFPISLIKPGKSKPTGGRLTFEILVISVPDHSESGLAYGANNETPPKMIYIGSRPCANTVGQDPRRSCFGKPLTPFIIVESKGRSMWRLKNYVPVASGQIRKRFALR